MTHPAQEATANGGLHYLRHNYYPGRGIVMGVNEANTHFVQITWTMGRSAGSRNRIYENNGGRVFTEAATPIANRDPNLFYDAMVDFADIFVIGNGDQTSEVIRGSGEGWNMSRSLNHFRYEDDPISTPRITAFASLRSSLFEFSLLRRSVWGDETCERHFYQYKTIAPGYGYCLTTYDADGDPPPAFKGEPLLLPIRGSMEEVLDTYWNALNVNNRVSLAVKFVDLKTFDSTVLIENKYSKVLTTA